jgi:Zn-dependent protease
MTGHRRRRSQHTVDIRAPRRAVWDAITAERSMSSGGLLPATLTTEAVLGAEDVFRTIWRVGDGAESKQGVITWRQTLRQEGKSLHCQILSEGTDPAFIQGTDELIGYELADIPEATRLTMFRESTPRHFFDALLVPFTVRANARAFRKQLHNDAGVSPTTFERFTGFAMTISLLAVASFWYLRGLQSALIISMVIILHELGHASAMRIVGMRVKRIYLIPFVGGVAVAKTPYRTDFQLGFVCLMGPGFSLIPTFAFLAAYLVFGGDVLFQAAMASAVVNALNLLPILPLDGGHVLQTILNAVSRRLAIVVAWIGVPFALLELWWLKDQSAIVALATLAIFLLSVAGLYVNTTRKDGSTAPMSRAAAAGLFAGFIVTAAGHAIAGYMLYQPIVNLPAVAG